jgi:transposase-like protein
VNSVTVPGVIDQAKVRSLQRAGQRVTDAVEARNAAIVEAHQAGATLRDIGEAVGLSHVAVMKIIKRH